jgi:hypothetical protein
MTLPVMIIILPSLFPGSHHSGPKLPLCNTVGAGVVGDDPVQFSHSTTVRNYDSV